MIDYDGLKELGRGELSRFSSSHRSVLDKPGV